MSKRRRIGIDIDGVLADFTAAWIKQANELYPGAVAGDWIPRSWNHEESGLGKEQVAAIWKSIRESYDFWANVPPLPGAGELDEAMAKVLEKADLYFITARQGNNVREQTDKWLNVYVPSAPAQHHLILVDTAYHKIEMMHAMDIRALLDDKGAFVAVARDLPTSDVWLMRRPWNEHERLAYHLPSVESVTEYLKKVNLI